MMTRTQGDVKIFLLPGGIEIKYQGGEPIRDTGLENMVLILLFTEPGWSINKILPLSDQIGSDYLAECRKPITFSQLRKIEIAAQAALAPFEANGVGIVSDLSVRMATGVQIVLTFTLSPPCADPVEICLSGFGRNWELQQEAA